MLLSLTYTWRLVGLERGIFDLEVREKKESSIRKQVENRHKGR